MVASAVAKLGENISIKRFRRFKVGEVTGTRRRRRRRLLRRSSLIRVFKKRLERPGFGRGAFFCTPSRFDSLEVKALFNKLMRVK